LIIYTFVILKQINYIQTKNLGYDKEHVLVLPMGGNMLQNFEVNKQAFREVPGVLSVTASYETPEFVEWGDGVNVTNEDGVQKISVKAMPVDLDLVETLNVQLVAGRDFVKSDFALLDTTNQGANYKQPYIINETLAQKIGWTPEEAIGKSIEKGVSGPILGVVKDFNFSSLHKPIGPLLIFLGRDFSRLYMLKINSADVPATLARLENVWRERVGDRPFNYHFLDEDFDALYKDEQRTAKLFSVSAGLAIVLACLGLFGLAAFSTVRRTKEIGIRKTLGASLGDIVMLLGKNFLILVSIAILIAAPLALWAARNWLQNFSYRIEPGANVFIIAALSTLVITFLTVGYHSLKAARSNPVKSLRTE
ncbi:MAG: FtsX-like permease family protein, partial [Flavobacteriaceae bacterium]|nr:FtsX-like permease family protein [Flavobacteriaceae bacterium]